MSFMTYDVKCKKCGEIYHTAFGIVGMTQIAAPLEKCTKCGGEVERIKDDWEMESQPKINAPQMEDLCIHCGCNGHHVEITYDEDIDYVYMSIEVKSRGFWSALKEAWKLFHGVRTGCFEEVILDAKKQEQIYDYLRRISNRRTLLKKGG